MLGTIIARLPVTLELLIISQCMALLLALPSGIVGAYRSNSMIDRFVNGIGFATLSIPSFVMALLTIYLFSMKLRWLPATGYVPVSVNIGANLKSFVLPGLSIAMIEWVVLMRVLRSDMITTLGQNYILMAKAKGLPPWRVLLQHALRPSSFTLITVLGSQIGRHLGEAVIVETIFALPGIGRLLIDSIYARDYQMVQGCILLITIFCLGFLTIPVFCRVARAKTLALSGLEFIQAARLTGAGNMTILFREIAPNVIVPVAIYGLLVVAFMIMAEGALSFLGLGIPAPTPSWGGMIAEGKEVLDEFPHVSLIPAAIMFMTVVSFNLIGDSLRSYFERGQPQI